MKYAVGSNMPGCLPDNEPYVTDDLDDARSYLIDYLYNDRDDEYESQEFASVNERYQPAFDAAESMEPDTYVHVPGVSQHSLGLNYYIATTEDEGEE